MTDFEQTEQDVREIERELELPPDELYPGSEAGDGEDDPDDGVT